MLWLAGLVAGGWVGAFCYETTRNPVAASLLGGAVGFFVWQGPSAALELWRTAADLLRPRRRDIHVDFIGRGGAMGFKEGANSLLAPRRVIEASDSAQTVEPFRRGDRAG